jgi:hypothetical protein
MIPVVMGVLAFLDFVGKVEKQHGPMIGRAIGLLMRAHFRIEYTPEQSASFVENELHALQLRADDLERANR